MKATQHPLRTVGKGSLSVLAAGLLLTSCSAPSATPPPEAAAPSPAATAPATMLNTSYNELMVAWIDNASHVLWDAEKPGFAPKNDPDWIEIEDHAIQVAAAGTVIQLAGAGPRDAMWAEQDGWKTNARLMSEAGKTAADAAKNRNLPALIEANGKLVQTCEGCHKQFKPELPSEGIAHQRPHSESHRSN
jgi:hypothetical protein